MNKKHASFEYSLSVKDFMTTDVYRKTQQHAMRTALGLIAAGLLLPLFVGLVTSLPDLGKEYFSVCVYSNSVLAFIFCLPLSLGLIWISLPVYHRILNRLFERYGFVKRSEVSETRMTVA